MAKIEFEDGSVYKGRLVSGKPHGKGKLTYPDGLVYEGGFVHDRCTGKGKLTMNGDFLYEGEFFNAAYHGDGRRMESDGKICKASFVQISNPLSKRRSIPFPVVKEKPGKIKLEDIKDIDNQHELADIAKGNNIYFDESYSHDAKRRQINDVREEAIKKLTDIKLLNDFAKDNESGFIYEAIYRLITLSKETNNKNILIDVAMSGDYLPEIRFKAAEEIDETLAQKAYESIANNCCIDYIHEERIKAIKKLTSIEALEKILNGGDSYICEFTAIRGVPGDTYFTDLTFDLRTTARERLDELKKLGDTGFEPVTPTV